MNEGDLMWLMGWAETIFAPIDRASTVLSNPRHSARRVICRAGLGKPRGTLLDNFDAARGDVLLGDKPTLTRLRDTDVLKGSKVFHLADGKDASGADEDPFLYQLHHVMPPKPYAGPRFQFVIPSASGAVVAYPFDRGASHEAAPFYMGLANPRVLAEGARIHVCATFDRSVVDAIRRPDVWKAQADAGRILSALFRYWSFYENHTYFYEPTGSYAATYAPWNHATSVNTNESMAARWKAEGPRFSAGERAWKREQIVIGSKRPR